MAALLAQGNSESDKYRFNTGFLTGSDYYRYPKYIGKDKTIMKRLLSILLVSVLVFSVTATVYAAGNSGSTTINVAGEYSVASTGEVVSVDVGWEEMSFKYTEGEKQWDPGTHSYIGGENGG